MSNHYSRSCRRTDYGLEMENYADSCGFQAFFLHHRDAVNAAEENDLYIDRLGDQVVEPCVGLLDAQSGSSGDGALRFPIKSTSPLMLRHSMSEH